MNTKKIMIAISLVLTVFLVGCGGNSIVSETFESSNNLTEENSSTLNLDSDHEPDFANDTASEAFENDNYPTEEDSPTLSLDSNNGFDSYYEEEFCEGDFDIRKFRPRFYDMALPFAELVGLEVFDDWLMSRSDEERENENVAVSFIRDFNISREDFTRANEELRQLWASHGALPTDSDSFELYPVDLIFTFDNERINRYFLRENSAAVVNFGMGMETGNARPLFYNMPGPFAELVGRETFIEWKHSRSDEQRANESIAVSFIKYFNISREDFTKANEEVRRVWNQLRASAEDGAIFEVYDVDLIFSFDNERINEFFLWENSLNPQEREFGRGERE